MRDLTATGKKINSKIGKAINDYALIEEGDKILVGISGGKDSITLMHLLKLIQGWAPVKFSLYAVHVMSDFQSQDKEYFPFLEDFIRERDIEFFIEKINVLNEKKKATCFWCSWNRRKSIFELADKLRCNKVALAHHKDDIAETMLMNLLYNGEISAMNPKQELFKGKITIIRPLCYVEEDLTKKFIKELGYGSYTCNCPYNDQSRRKFIKDFIKQADRHAGKMDIKTNLFKAISRVKAEYMDMVEEKK